jgi:hypothetical protein
MKLLRTPEQLRFGVESLERGSWVVIDEIQRLPQLLNEIHSLIADHGNAFNFALSGSSARKLKRLDANLLAGMYRGSWYGLSFGAKYTMMVMGTPRMAMNVRLSSVILSMRAFRWSFMAYPDRIAE